MSDPVTKAERSKAKDLRQSPAPEEQKFRKNRKRKKDKPYIVEERWHFNSLVAAFNPNRANVWRKFGAYATLEEAERVAAKRSLKYYSCEYRVRPLEED